MTIDERARKIWNGVTQYCQAECDNGASVDWVADQLRAVQEEAIMEFVKLQNLKDAKLNSEIGRIAKENFGEGLLRAAEIVEHHRDGKVGTLKIFYAEDRMLAQRIRAEAEGLHPKQKPENQDDGQHNQ